MDELINLSNLADLSGGDEEFERDLMNNFILQANKTVTRLNELYREKKFEEMSPGAHKFKSSLTVFGMYPIYDKILQIETMTKNMENMDDLPDLLNETKLLIFKAIEQLNFELRKFD